MALTRIDLNHSEATAAGFLSVCPLTSSSSRRDAQNLSAYFAALGAGVRNGLVELKVGAVQATGTVVFTGAPTNNEIVTIANVVLTAKTSGAVANEFNIGTAAVTGNNLAAAINASSALSGIVTATSNGSGTVTVTCVVAGKAGNGTQLSEGLTNATATAFANGSDGTAYTVDRS